MGQTPAAPTAAPATAAPTTSPSAAATNSAPTTTAEPTAETQKPEPIPGAPTEPPAAQGSVPGTPAATDAVTGTADPAAGTLVNEPSVGQAEIATPPAETPAPAATAPATTAPATAAAPAPDAIPAPAAPAASEPTAPVVTPAMPEPAATAPAAPAAPATPAEPAPAAPAPEAPATAPAAAEPTAPSPAEAPAAESATPAPAEAPTAAEAPAEPAAATAAPEGSAAPNAEAPADIAAPEAAATAPASPPAEVPAAEAAAPGAAATTHTATHQEITDVAFSFEGPFGKFDQFQLQRGLQVYTEVCAACHGLRYVPIRTLADPGGPGLPEDQVRAYAATMEIDDAETGETRPRLPSDHFPHNTAAGAPDLSVMAKGRAGFHGPYGTGINQLLHGIGGPEYIYSILTHYTGETKEEAGETFYGNTAFPGGWIKMPPPLSDDQVTYEDGHPATTSDEAKDVAAFLMWTAEPKMMARKQVGLVSVIFLIGLTMLLYMTNKRLWWPIKHPTLRRKAIAATGETVRTTEVRTTTTTVDRV
ncbi:cytochrome c1 [Paracoccus suum]|uniref:Cytochrome c1 n=1 Tax=Paracoccus suum TaxID=2259340 RepID=A0A344PNY3_9RHOB|nr:cytochrome c1 [Paracoccus suum]